jgi:hypothetical protein
VLEREWVSIRDPENQRLRYTFDVSFLLSSYRCIYGQGCQGVYPGAQDPAIGCCIHGAYVNEDDDPEELLRIVEEELDPSTMQFPGKAMKKGIFTEDDEGEFHTRVVKGGCIFSNRSGFEAGEGCALHHLAERKGEHHMTYKPVVCWQVPLHRTVDELVANDGEAMEVHTIAAYERGHWGEGGSEFDWWCLDDDVAFTSPNPVYRSMEAELREMVGDAVYEELADHLDRKRRSKNRIEFLPVV